MGANVKGFSLIEVLVALVILVVGLVGIFNLHIVAKRGSFESYQQTLAAYYANDMLSRMKLNTPELINYKGTYVVATGATATAPKSCDVVDPAVLCNSGEIRAWDTYQWQFGLNGSYETLNGSAVGGLNQATACIDVNASGEVQVVISWQGVRQLSDGAALANDFAKSCGSANPKRRQYSVSTVIV
ncbi:type IV pilus modification protein PilV [Shewanella sp. NIFS-20-20]|uniref:type IV pilus modification protein PilV n=1 Tax=Shewanella sp. NIFS-20-20 TaxID=2853806 RepID=UPI001C450061|nr:type IV pilus modification protein PilV [Shewanella sp. NIFS-20-20]MBV7314182.1 type IV pilus modification protein PilV [Shewanella sp. NIFS-20-20]